MLFVIPVEDKPSWRRLPAVCIILILLNFGLFGFLDMQDRTIEAQAAATYRHSGMLAREWPLYLAYLEETRPEHWAQLQGVPPEHRAAAAEQTLLVDRGFDAWLHARPDGDHSNASWQQARHAFEAQRNRLSSIRFGLAPGDMHVENLFTHMFMHGSWDHVIGNMLFLALFGVALEARLGHLLLLVLYIGCGLAAGLAHALMANGSMGSLVGASGAIAGMMGMYVGTYGTKVREFLVMIGPWLGSVRAPALIMFPLWLGKEVLSGIYATDNVAYWAHAGGLLAGLLIVLPFRARPPATPATPAAGAAADEPAAAPPAISVHLQQLAESGQFEKAVAACGARLERDPGNKALWDFYLDNAARAGNDALLRAAGRLLATLNGTTPDYGAAAHGYLKLKELRAELRRLSPQHRLLQCELLLHMDRVDEAHTVIRTLLDGSWRHPRLTRTALAVAARLADPRDAAALKARLAASTPPAAPAGGQ